MSTEAWLDNASVIARGRVIPCMVEDRLHGSLQSHCWPDCAVLLLPIEPVASPTTHQSPTLAAHSLRLRNSPPSVQASSAAL